MVINTNIAAMNSSRLLAESSTQLSKSLARLSSGSKLISPEDDVAGMAVSMRFDAQINRIGATTNNVSNAISFSQTQDGFLNKVGKALDRMSELAVLSQDVTKTDSDRLLYNKEFGELQNYVKDIANKDFNGVSLFSGTTQDVTVDSDATKFNMAGIDMGAADYTKVGNASQTSVDTASNANTALSNVKAAIVTMTTNRATVGASLARLQYTNDQLGVLKTNLSASNSRLKDVDVAEESTQYARYNILVQAGTAMLAQANSAPQSVLRLLG